MNFEEAILISGACDSAITRSENSTIRKYGPWARQLYVLIYVYKGKGYFEVGGKTYEITAGQSFLIYPGVTVCYWADAEDEWDYFWVDFYGELAEELASKMSFSIKSPVISVKNDSIIEPFKRLVDKYYQFATPVEAHQIGLVGDFMNLVSEYMRIYGEQKSKSQSTIEQIVAYISTNFCDPTLTPYSIAEHFALSRTGLYRLFKEQLGISPKKHINNIRIENACTILHRSDRQIKEIALSVGFKDPLYFSKVFKEKNGVSPSDYFEYYHKYLK